ncbi:aminotransferase class I/II-fold pyridoxal phosphate-dependent enzyme [Eubacteriales bacterium KG127]
MLEFLSKRGKSNVRPLPALVKAHFDALEDIYDKDTNPNGYINFGTAETKLVDEEAIALLEKVSRDMDLKPWNLHYNRFHGNDEFRSAIAQYWSKIIYPDSSRNISKDQIATTCGCTEALEMLAFLLADRGDIVLVPAPYYSSFVDDIGDRAGVKVVGVDCTANLEYNKFKNAFAEVEKTGGKVRAILFSSPNNPTGIVYKEKAIKNLIQFAIDKNIDVISDEIYAETVFGEGSKYVSTLRLAPEEYLHRIHVTSSFAKDFALSGFRTGFCISHNPNIIKGMETISYFSSVSSYTQAILTSLLESDELEKFMCLSRTRLKESCIAIRKGLRSIGVETENAEAGIFVWADFSQFLDENSFSSEYKLWEKIYNDLKINISPGQLFGANRPGYFRLCYANSLAEVTEACVRLSRLKK